MATGDLEKQSSRRLPLVRDNYIDEQTGYGEQQTCGQHKNQTRVWNEVVKSAAQSGAPDREAPDRWQLAQPQPR